MSAFIDHLQLLPMPHQDGRRPPDGAHRPAGLGMATISARLEQRGWTPRHEDIGFDRRLPEPRLAEAYARGLGDAVASAWDRNRFPVLLLRSSYGALGPIDALGEGGGVAWVDTRAKYSRPRLLRRTPLDRCALSLVTGRAKRDPYAVKPVQLPGARVVVVGAERASRAERGALAADGVRVVGLDRLAAAIADADAERWHLHVDLGALSADAVPAADDAGAGSIDPQALAQAIDAAFEGRTLAAAGFARYDLNRDADDRTAATLVGLIDATVVAAGGVASPGARESVR
jgi:hypothetical protein